MFICHDDVMGHGENSGFQSVEDFLEAWEQVYMRPPEELHEDPLSGDWYSGNRLLLEKV